MGQQPAYAETLVARLLIVEDDVSVREAIRLALEGEGHEVAEAESTEEALDQLEARLPDVVLVDLTLPRLDGFECIRGVRRRTDAPIIVVSARADTHDVVAGLEAGADDYVTKPFVMGELSARIRAALRRVRDTSDTGVAVRFGQLELRPEEGILLREGEPVHLTRTEFRLLCELAEGPGRLFSREQLLEKVWGYDYFGDGRLVDVHISRLRSKIELDPANPRHLITSRGLGYKLQS